MKLTRIDRVEERQQPADLRVEDAVDLGIGLVLDPTVGEYASAVDQASYRPRPATNLLQQVIHGLPIPNIDGVIRHIDAGSRNPLETVPDLALGLD